MDMLFPEEAMQMVSTIREVHNLYASGIPLFTKNAIRKVGDELAAFRKGGSDCGTFILKGINGVDYIYTICVPPYLPPLEENKHYGDSTWIIKYQPIERLTDYHNTRRFNPDIAYLPMVISYSTLIIPDLEREENTPELSIRYMHRNFKEAGRRFDTSDFNKQLQRVLAKLKIPFVLEKLVGISLGSPIGRSPRHKQSTLQHLLVSALASGLCECGILSGKSKHYMQNTDYTMDDKFILNLEAFNVVDDPEAFLLLDESSVLVSISANVPVKQIVADICRPGIIIWDKGGLSSMSTDPVSSRVVEMLVRDYYEVDLPYHERLGKLAMHVRK